MPWSLAFHLARGAGVDPRAQLFNQWLAPFRRPDRAARLALPNFGRPNLRGRLRCARQFSRPFSVFYKARMPISWMSSRSKGVTNVLESCSVNSCVMRLSSRPAVGELFQVFPECHCCSSFCNKLISVMDACVRPAAHWLRANRRTFPRARAAFESKNDVFRRYSTHSSVATQNCVRALPHQGKTQPNRRRFPSACAVACINIFRFKSCSARGKVLRFARSQCAAGGHKRPSPDQLIAKTRAA